MQKPLLVLFDGNNIVHRAFHAFEPARPLTVRKTGEVVSAVYILALMLFKVIKDLKPTCYAIAFDTPAPTFRHQLFDQYKAQRPPTPDELLNQLSSSVQWQRSVEYMIDNGVSTFIEIGPGNVLTGLIRRINRDAKTVNLGDAEAIKNLADQSL